MNDEVLERIQKRFDEKVKRERRKVTLPHLEQEVHIFPEMADCTCAIKDANNDIEIFVALIVFRCRDENGTRLYNRNEAKVLMRTLSAEDLVEVVNVILAGDPKLKAVPAKAEPKKPAPKKAETPKAKVAKNAPKQRKPATKN